MTSKRCSACTISLPIRRSRWTDPHSGIVHYRSFCAASDATVRCRHTRSLSLRCLQASRQQAVPAGWVPQIAEAAASAREHYRSKGKRWRSSTAIGQRRDDGSSRQGRVSIDSIHVNERRRDALREAYDAVYSRGAQEVRIRESGWPRNRYEAVLRLAPRGRRVLDVGCGDGDVLAALAPRFEFLAGVELSPNRAENARARLSACGAHFDIAQVNLEHGLPYDDCTFDCIVWADVVEHVVDVFGSMREVARALAPGGRLVTITPNIAGIRKRLTLLTGRFPSTSAASEGIAVRPGELFDGGHLHYFTFSSIEALYRRAGVEPERSMGFGRFGRLHDFRPTLLSGEVAVVGRKP